MDQELIRLRDRLHEVANACAQQYAKLQTDIYDLRADVRVLEERIENFGDELAGLKRAVWTLVGTVLAGVIVYLLTQALGGEPSL